MQAAGHLGVALRTSRARRSGSAPDESALWAVATTDASNGSVNSMHDSYQPLGVLAPMFNMAIGEVIFGGVGSGLYGMIFYVVIAVFIGGLMVGRTPEYLGKKIRRATGQDRRDRRPGAVPGRLALHAVAVVLPAGLAGTAQQGPHGFSEIFYAYLSQGNNNGSAFAGLTANTPFYTITGGIAMLVSRFVPLARRPRAGRERRHARGPCRSPRGPSAPTPACSSAC